MAALWYACRLLVLCEIEPNYGAAALVGLLVCPLCCSRPCEFTMTGWRACSCFAGLSPLPSRSNAGPIIPALEAAVWLVAAMNVRFNAIAALPLLLFMPAYALTRPRAPVPKNSPESRVGSAERAPLRPIWLVPAIVLGAVLTLGMQHYYRLIAAYGTLWPGAFVQPIGDVTKFSPFLAIVERTTRSWVCWELVAMFPLAVLFVAAVAHAPLSGRLASDGNGRSGSCSCLFGCS